MRAPKGFTLLEVLVALAVLAIAMGAVIGAATQSINTMATLRDQTFAGWVSLNQVHLLSLEAIWPEEGSHNGKVEMAQRTWYWDAVFSKTDDIDLRRVDVTVRMGEQGLILSRRIAFKGKTPEKPSNADEAAAEKDESPLTESAEAPTKDMAIPDEPHTPPEKKIRK